MSTNLPDKFPRVLILTTGLGKGLGDRGLTNELIDGFLELGASVRVVVVDWHRPTGERGEVVMLDNGVQALFTSPFKITRFGTQVANVVKWYLASIPARRAAKNFLRDEQFDLIMVSSPVVTCGHLLRWALRRFRCRSFAYLVDFFPFHQRAARQVPGGIPLRIMAKLENDLIRLVDVVGCMTKAGEVYLKNNYHLRSNQRVAAVTLWGDSSLPAKGDEIAIRNKLGLPEKGPIAVFGGQISEGRGIEDVLAAAEIARISCPDLHFLFIGSGRLEYLINSFILEKRGNVHIHSTAPRDEYLKILTVCSIALVATIADTGVPTFPSKTMDYLRAGLPIAASVEDSTDYTDFVVKWGFGACVAAGRPGDFLATICSILDDESRIAIMRNAGRKALREEFSPIAAAQRILALSGLNN